MLLYSFCNYENLHMLTEFGRPIRKVPYQIADGAIWEPMLTWKQNTQKLFEERFKCNVLSSIKSNTQQLENIVEVSNL